MSLDEWTSNTQGINPDNALRTRLLELSMRESVVELWQAIYKELETVIQSWEEILEKWELEFAADQAAEMSPPETETETEPEPEPEKDSLEKELHESRDD